MSLQVRLVVILVALETWALLNEVQNALNTAVEVGLGQLAALNTSYDAVELLGLTWLQHVVASPHLLGTVLTAKPVGHNGTLVAPLIAEDGGNKVFALRSVNTIDIVIRCHYSPRLTLLDGNLKALKINLAKSTLRDVSIVIHAVCLLVIGGKVLDAGTNVILLNTGDIGRSCLTSYNRILRVILEVTSAQRVTHNVEGRSQQHVGTILLHLLTNSLTYLLDELGVPC